MPKIGFVSIKALQAPLIWFLTFLAGCSAIFAQSDIKEYEGEFMDGFARYSYYLSPTGREVYHGPFEYEIIDQNGIVTTYKGKFEKGYKHGEWVFLQKGSFINLENKPVRVENNLVQNFDNGVKDGKFSVRLYSEAKNKDGEVLHGSKTGEVKYNKGIVSGQIIFDSEGEFYRMSSPFMSSKAHIGPDGFADGVWEISYLESGSIFQSDTITEKIEFDDGFLVSAERFVNGASEGKIENEFVIKRLRNRDGEENFEVAPKAYPIMYAPFYNNIPRENLNGLMFFSNSFNQAFTIDFIEGLSSGEKNSNEYYGTKANETTWHLFGLSEVNNYKGGIFQREFTDNKIENRFGISSLKNGNLTESLNHFKKALQFKKDYINANLNIAQFYAINGEFGLAMEYLDKLHYSESGENPEKVFSVKSDIYLAAGQWDKFHEAMKEYEKAASYKTDALAKKLLMAYFLSGKREEGLEYIASKYPGFDGISGAYLESVNRFFEKGEYFEAEELLKYAVPENESGRLLEIDVLTATGNFNEAMAKTDKILSDNKSGKSRPGLLIRKLLIEAMNGKEGKIAEIAAGFFAFAGNDEIKQGEEYKTILGAAYILLGGDEKARYFIKENYSAEYYYNYEGQGFYSNDDYLLAKSYYIAAFSELLTGGSQKSLEYANDGISLIEMAKSEINMAKELLAEERASNIETDFARNLFYFDFSKSVFPYTKAEELTQRLQILKAHALAFNGQEEKAAEIYNSIAGPDSKKIIFTDFQLFNKLGLNKTEIQKIRKMID